MIPRFRTFPPDPRVVTLSAQSTPHQKAVPLLSTTLVVGVTGHRNLRPGDLPRLQEQVRVFLSGLSERHPGLPVSVLSSLAEGSDQLVAYVALAMGIRVVAPLPMSPELFREDFLEPGARAVFDRQLQQVDLLVLPTFAGNDAGAIARPGPARDVQYAQAGIFISSHCHILLALWDGRPSELLGGTAQVVDYHLRGDMPAPMERRRAALGLLGLGEETIVHHIPVARQGDAEGTPGQPRWLTCDQDIVEHAALPASFVQMFEHHCEFNLDWAQYASQIGSRPDDPGLRRDPNPIRALFEVADWLASTYQRRVSRVLMITYLLAALMGFSFILYADVTNQDVMLYLFLLFFAAGFAVTAVASQRSWHRQYIDYRALAEGLRVQSFWRRAGIVDVSSSSFAHDNFLQKQDVELGWIRNVMRGASLDGLLQPLVSGEEQVAEVIDEWIGTEVSPGQLQYYTVTALRRTHSHGVANGIGNVCLWLGISISVVLAAFAHQIAGMVQNLMVATMGVLSVTVAVHEAYAYRKADKELIKQYRYMRAIFAAAMHQLQAASSLKQQRKILRVLGEAALAEHAEWTLMHRERPLEHSRL